MSRKMLLGIRARAERDSLSPALASDSGEKVLHGVGSG
jgi:hypothetical protein